MAEHVGWKAMANAMDAADIPGLQSEVLKLHRNLG